MKQINEIRRMQQLAGLINESQLKKKSIPKFETGYEIIKYFDKIPAFKQYRNKNASGDDIFFKIPINVFSKEIGWTEEEVEKIDDNLSPYEGSIYYWKNKVLVQGGDDGDDDDDDDDY